MPISFGLPQEIRTDKPAEEFSVLTHEFAHYLLDHVTGTRLPYADDREAEAEGVSCLLCEAVGLQNGVEAATAYLHSWHGSLTHLKVAREFVLWGAQYVWDAIGPRQLQSHAAIAVAHLCPALRMVVNMTPFSTTEIVCGGMCESRHRRASLRVRLARPIL